MRINKGKSTHHFRGLLNSSNLSCTVLDFSQILTDYSSYAVLGTFKYAVVLETLEATINLFSFPLAQLPVIDFTMSDSEKAAAMQKVEQSFPGVMLQVSDSNGAILFSFKCQNYNGIEYYQPLLIPGLAFREFKALDVSHKLIASSLPVSILNLGSTDYIYIEGTLSIYTTLFRPLSYGVGEYGVTAFSVAVQPGQTVIVPQIIVNTALVDRVAVTSPCRVRCYRDQASAQTDLVRPTPTQFQQTNVSGLNFELNFGTGVDLAGNPVTVLDCLTKANTILRCGQGSSTSWWSITNTGNASSITLTIYYEVLV